MSTGPPSITQYNPLTTQVCVPADWTDEQAKAFADERNPCGTSEGWHVLEDGNEDLCGTPGRVQCHNHDGNIHICLQA